jgi:mannose-6-phosphate isomerase class I
VAELSAEYGEQYLGAAVSVASCPFFDLDVIRVGGRAFVGDTGGATLHVVTVTAGRVQLSSGGEIISLDAYETAIVAGEAGSASCLRARAAVRP